MIAGGFFEILIIMLLFGVGYPVGMPPGELNPVMLQAAPDKCAYFVSWVETVEPTPGSTNPTIQYLSQKSILRTMRRLDQMLTEIPQSVIFGFGNDRKSFELVAPLIREMTRKAVTFYVQDVSIEDGIVVDIALLMDCKNDRAKIEPMIDDFFSWLAAERNDELEVSTIDGMTVYEIDDLVSGFPLMYAFNDRYLLVGFGEDAIANLKKNMERPTPEWLTKALQELPVDKFCSISYLDLNRVNSTLRPFRLFVPELDRVLTEFGVDHLTNLVAVVGLDEDGMIQKTRIESSQPTPMFRSFGSRELTAEEIEVVSPDSYLALTTKLEKRDLLRLLMNSLKATEPNSAKELDELLNTLAGEDQNFDQLLEKGFDDTLTFYSPPGDGGLFNNWIVGLEIKDAKIVDDMLQKWSSEVLEFSQFRIKAAGDLTFVIAKDDSPWSPPFCFSVQERHVWLASNPVALKSHLLRAQKPAGTKLNDRYLAFLNGPRPNDAKLVSAWFIDEKQMLKSFYPMFGFLLATTGDDPIGQYFPREHELPSLGEVTNIKHPLITRVLATERSVTFETKKVFPTGDSFSNLAFLTLSSGPIVWDFNFNQIQGVGARMNRIGAALESYHRDHGAYPPSYSVSPDGKPLLSWRVHLLPYLGEDGLYNQFNLNEPWDSEQNKPLSTRLPSIFGTDRGEGPAGETGYLAISAKGGFFEMPEQGADQAPPRGRKMVELGDDANGTILVVNVDQDSRVLWSKPGDFDEITMEPMAKFKRVSGRKFFALMADGKVRKFANTLMPEAFQELCGIRDSQE